MVRFIHTADWQIGLGRRFLAPEARSRYAEARCEAVAAIAELARTTDASFVLVCGDVFESNLIDRRVLRRCLEAVRSISVPVLMLPGNHDALDPGSVYLSPTFQQHLPPNVTVLEGTAMSVLPGVQVIAAPWRTRRPLGDLVGEAIAGLARAEGSVRIVAGHGRIDDLAPDPDDPSLISLAAAESALSAGLVHYVALGDRHSVTSVGSSGRIWYPGTPEVTDFDEGTPGQVLAVDLDESSCRVAPHAVGKWTFTRRAVDVSDEDIDPLRAWLSDLPDKSRTVLRLALRGTLSLSARARLDDVLDEYREVLAGLDLWDAETELIVLPDSLESENLDLSGFARTTLEQLLAGVRQAGDPVATEALRLLHRLARSA